MSMLNIMLPVAAPMAEGPRWAVASTTQGKVAFILRDDGVTVLSAYMDRASYNRATLIARLNASAGATAGELAVIAAMAAASNW